MTDTVVRLSGVSKSYDGTPVLRDVSLTVDRGELVALLGPSGCGKSTLFHLISGLTATDGGSLTAPETIGYMQQKDLLLPWKTVIDNITLPLVLRGKGTKAARRAAEPYLDLVGLRGYEAKYPYQLSGGMRQRASFLRTFLSSGSLLLLDEPFGALDAITRTRMQDWLGETLGALGATSLLITHDIDEALRMADRIYLLSPKPTVVVEHVVVDGDRVVLKSRILGLLKE